MAGNKITKILFCSVLKPANDVRQCQKLAASVATLPKVEAVSVGCSSTNKEEYFGKVRLVSPFSYSRCLVKRIFSVFKICKILLKEKPEVVVVCSSDLLIVASIYKILFNAKLCYDLQENYSLNLTESAQWPFLLKYCLAFFSRAVEIITSPLVNYFFLAEAVYARQLNFLSPTRSIILANKFLPYPEWEFDKLNAKRNPNLYLISGTLGAAYQVLETIDWFLAEILPDNSKAELLIAGFSPDKNYLTALNKKIQGHSSIKILGGESPLPHRTIIQCQLKATFGIINLAKNLAMDEKVATKVFEYAANELVTINLAKKELNILAKFSNQITKEFSWNRESLAIKDIITKELLK